MNAIDLTHRRAVITGGAQGIGKAVASRFLRSGASVSLWDRDIELAKAAQAELSTLGRVHISGVDVTSEEQVSAAASDTRENLGGIDILVANAGITGPNLKLWEYPLGAWSDV